MLNRKCLSVLLFIFIAANHEAAWSTSMYPANVTPAEKSGQYIDDSVITTKVKSALLANKNIKSFSISVSTSQGVVTLTGHVNTNMQKKNAVKIASRIEGVKSVNDELAITVN